ncbi:MAG: archease [Candidatus Omnitrophica bacterium]|nr:archease [Candidatus Omnitrophota bacterium]
MTDKSYELIEHTADVGIRVKGKDLRGLFNNAALAMFDIIGEPAPIPSATSVKEIPKFKVNIRQKAENLEELFVNWLNELLSLSSAKGLMFVDFVINKLDRNKLEAQVYGEKIKNYRVNTEIKAATYHELKVQEVSGGWQAEVIFDV